MRTNLRFFLFEIIDQYFKFKKYQIRQHLKKKLFHQSFVMNLWLEKWLVAKNCWVEIKENADIDDIKYNGYRYKLGLTF